VTDTTIFKKIIDGDIPADIVYEDDLCLAFHDINAQAPVHLLVIPRKEISSLADLDDEDQQLMGHMQLVIRKLAAELGLDNGRRPPALPPARRTDTQLAARLSPRVRRPGMK
jgi:histidine triad (HIT) family protein